MRSRAKRGFKPVSDFVDTALTLTLDRERDLEGQRRRSLKRPIAGVPEPYSAPNKVRRAAPTRARGTRAVRIGGDEYRR